MAMFDQVWHWSFTWGLLAGKYNWQIWWLFGKIFSSHLAAYLKVIWWDIFQLFGNEFDSYLVRYLLVIWRHIWQIFCEIFSSQYLYFFGWSIRIFSQIIFWISIIIMKRWGTPGENCGASTATSASKGFNFLFNFFYFIFYLNC